MAFPTITNSFPIAVSAPTFYVSHANANFTDIANAFSDGATDIQINKITCGGTAIVSGTTVVLNATSPVVNAANALTLSVGTVSTITFGSLSAISLGSGNISSSSSPVTNTIYTTNIPKAHGFAVAISGSAPTNATGVVPKEVISGHQFNSSGTVGINFEYETSWWDGSSMVVNLRTPMANNEYTVICNVYQSLGGPGGILDPSNLTVTTQTVTGFVVDAWNQVSGVARSFDSGDGVFFSVYGDQ